MQWEVKGKRGTEKEIREQESKRQQHLPSTFTKLCKSVSKGYIMILER
jgi:hypothetical protein